MCVVFAPFRAWERKREHRSVIRQKKYANMHRCGLKSAPVHGKRYKHDGFNNCCAQLRAHNSQMQS